MATLIFESPIVFDVLDDTGELYDEVTAPDEVCEALIDDVQQEMSHMGPRGLAAFGGPAEHIGIKVQCNRQTGRPTAKIIVNMPDYDEAALDELRGYVEGQFSDGWGEGYEQHVFHEDYDGYRWSARFWNPDHWYFKQV